MKKYVCLELKYFSLSLTIDLYESYSISCQNIHDLKWFHWIFGKNKNCPIFSFKKKEEDEFVIQIQISRMASHKISN